MRVHAALTPADMSGLVLGGCAAIVIDVLRATSTVIAACAAGCRQVIPAPDLSSARACAGRLPAGEVVLAGERGGEPVEGFDLGNSPLEFTPERVRGRTIVLTTTNGTAAMLAAGAAASGAVAALNNVSAAGEWAARQGRDVAVLCAGDDGAFSLEDTVCAGLLVGQLAERDGARLTDGAHAALGLGRYYAERLEQLGDASRWARRLIRAGRGPDVAACLRRDTTAMVPLIGAGGVASLARDAADERMAPR